MLSVFTKTNFTQKFAKIILNDMKRQSTFSGRFESEILVYPAAMTPTWKRAHSSNVRALHVKLEIGRSGIFGIHIVV